MASDDEVLVVAEEAAPVLPVHRDEVGADVIDVSDDDIEVVADDEPRAEEDTQDVAKCSMDCCGAAVPVERVQERTNKALQGETLSLVDMCTTLVCPSCGNPLSTRDIGAALAGASVSESPYAIMRKVQQLAIGSLCTSAATNAMAQMLKDDAPQGTSWLHNDWFLSHLTLGQVRVMLRSRGLSAQGEKAACIKRLLKSADVKRAMPQIAAALGLMGCIIHLRLVILDRLPEEHYVTLRQQTCPASTSGEMQKPLYDLSRIGSSTPAAAPAANENKRPERNTDSASTQPASKRAKHGASVPATKAAVATGVGYGSDSYPSYSYAMEGFSSAMGAAMAAMSGMLGGLPASMPPPPMPHSQPHDAAALTKSAVASGVGYGGHVHPGYKAHKSSKQHQQYAKKQRSIKEQQENVRNEKAACVRAILRLLRASCPNPVMGPMPAPLAIMLHGGLSSVLHDLLEDSIDALLDDAAVQRPLLTLLEALSAHLTLLPVLTAKGSWPVHLLPDGDRAAKDTSGPSGTSIAQRLGSMRAGCDLWQREGQRMLDDEDAAGPSNAATRDPADDIALVLHASSTGDCVRSAIEASANYHEENAPANAPEGIASTEATGGRSSRHKSQQAAQEASAARDAAMREQHASAMHQHAFFQVPLEHNHAYRNEAQQVSHESASYSQRNKAIMKQLTSLSSSLPAHFESSVHVAVATERTDMARVLILAGPDTPYAYGAFVFDVFFPANFPNAPPKMKFLTTGGGRVRFNPNLYNCGKVCLSLLGTWSGPSWSPGSSTFLQVLVSLQAMVFCEYPYFNEPGYQASAGTAQGDRRSQQYNANLRGHTAQHAILDCLNHPDGHPHGVFKDVLALHWRAKGPLLKQYLKEHKVPRGKEISKKLDALLVDQS